MGSPCDGKSGAEPGGPGILGGGGPAELLCRAALQVGHCLPTPSLPAPAGKMLRGSSSPSCQTCSCIHPPAVFPAFACVPLLSGTCSSWGWRQQGGALNPW